ncbi:uncharacterized protein [Onthophagus taurus]|uniref:uncharacterized protein n=1 Tax=Onthophagus taurus TaxID=166361 RepID=UPI000C20C659|nr:uncharacterized protein LOC111424358 [Onthophagus taurus]
MSSHHRYSTATSYVLLAGTGIYCIVKYTKYDVTDNLDLPLITFGVIAFHSLLGVWRWGNPDYGGKISKFFDITSHVRNALALSCMTGNMIIKARQDKFFGITIPVVSSIPLVMSFTEGCAVNEDFVDLLTAINVIFCGWFSYLDNENMWGIAAAISYMFARFGRYAERDIPDEDLSNFALCFFSYFAYRACGEITAKVL